MMRKTLFTFFFITVVAVPLVFSQVGSGGGRGEGARMYDRATELTLKGTVEDVKQPTGQKGWPGTHLTLKSNLGTFDVHVGPTSYISSQQFALAKGDTIEVIGSKVNVRGQDALLARQITKDGKVLILRDEQGFPLWSRAASGPKQ